jgi:hypothetical protein
MLTTERSPPGIPPSLPISYGQWYIIAIERGYLMADAPQKDIVEPDKATSEASKGYERPPSAGSDYSF